jgi:hypothetical protein
MSDRTYNGWTNYETWLVNLWMGNEFGSQEFFREQAEEIYGQETASEFFTRAECAANRFGDWLKEHHEDNRPEMPGVYGDLVGAALSAVNWDEIARQYIDTVKEESDATS